MKTLLTFFIALVLLAATYKVSAQCDATFRADSTNLGYFNFTPSGYGNFHWDFGDGDTSDLREPQHSFPAVGTYNVCLTVTDSAGTCTNTSCQNVYVAPCQVTANIVTASYTYSISEFSVAFTNTSSSNRCGGFAIQNHYFLPGFPQMAWPMMAWVLDTHYPQLFNTQVSSEVAIKIFDVPESQLIDLMQTIVQKYPTLKLFSLPSLSPKKTIELGLKGELNTCRLAITEIQLYLDSHQMAWQTLES